MPGSMKSNIDNVLSGGGACRKFCGPNEGFPFIPRIWQILGILVCKADDENTGSGNIWRAAAIIGNCWNDDGNLAFPRKFRKAVLSIKQADAMECVFLCSE